MSTKEKIDIGLLNMQEKYHTENKKMKIKIFNHTKDNEDIVRYVATNGKYQINMETLGENKMSEEQFRELATFHFNIKEEYIDIYNRINFTCYSSINTIDKHRCRLKKETN